MFRLLRSTTTTSLLNLNRRFYSMDAMKPAVSEPNIVLVDETLSPKKDDELNPFGIVDYLNKHIVGQNEAKRAIAIALRNRWRRQRVDPPFLRNEILPKNMLMVGPTGVGKTEIARRMAKLINAPFVKVEATKYTEVGFHGRDVDTIIRDLVANAIVVTKAKLRKKYEKEINEAVEKKLLELLTATAKVDEMPKASLLQFLRAGTLDETTVECVPERPANKDRELPGSNGQITMISIEALVRGDAAGAAPQGRGQQKQPMKLKEARRILTDAELAKFANEDTVRREAVLAAQNDGIVFIDEIDKVCYDHSSPYRGGDASNEGVQRDLLPIVEGCVVETKYGDIDTSHVLFIASGAFHAVKVKDLLPELQGRLPVRVELKALTEADLYRILTEPVANLVRQHVALLATEGLKVEFKEDGIRRIAHIAARVNAEIDNIGARRLHSVLEKIVEPISFEADKLGGEGKSITIDAEFVDRYTTDLLKNTDLKKFII